MTSCVITAKQVTSVTRVLIWMEVVCWSVSVMAENKTRQLLRGRDLFQLTVSQVTDGLTWSMALGLVGHRPSWKCVPEACLLCGGPGAKQSWRRKAGF